MAHNLQRKQELKQRNQAGFSLIEILVVLAIMALIAALVAPRLFGQVDKSKLTVASTQIKSIQTALDTLRLDIGRYPTQEEGLSLLVTPPSDGAASSSWFGPYLEDGLPADPWGRDYLYTLAVRDSQGFEMRPFVYSRGADGNPGGQGLDKDIGRLPD